MSFHSCIHFSIMRKLLMFTLSASSQAIGYVIINGCQCNKKQTETGIFILRKTENIDMLLAHRSKNFLTKICSACEHEQLP